MKTTVWFAGDQLTQRSSALEGLDPGETRVLLIESIARGRERPYHKRRLVLIYAAMRGFADDLRRAGWHVDYHAERDDYAVPLAEHIAAFRPERFRIMELADYGVTDRLATLVKAHGLVPEITPTVGFVSSADEFAELFARGQGRVTMETFYRRIRRRTGILMDGDEPLGGVWNFDRENRLPPKRGMRFPPQPKVPLRAHARAAIALVERQFADHPGNIGEFDIPTTRADARAYADDFFKTRLDDFGPYEDAMVAGEARLYHSRLSALINLGLLHPLELCERAERAYHDGSARLASVEGFVRQLIGWREFIWQTYRRQMPEYRGRNALHADLPVPQFYRDGETDMFCMREAMRCVLDLGWAHHILRLMVLGNFALLARVEPQALTDWFWEMFVDGHDWVMVPNVIGMTLHADGGLVGTKPYAASANYINKMSDYCSRCKYDPKKTIGEEACPYNALYWDFMRRNERRFASNPRMSLPLRNWRAKPDADKSAIAARAKQLRERMQAHGRV